MRDSTATKKFKSLDHLVYCLADLFSPPERLTVSQAAAKYRSLDNPGSYTGPWLNSMVPPLVEPMDIFADPDYSALIFVGPAQSSKTDSLCLNTLVYSVCVEPMDLMLYSPTQTDARDFSIRRVDRLHRHTKAVGGRLARSRDADNKFDKTYDNGVLFTLGYPTASQFAGKPIPRVVLTDYDRMADDIDGEGSAFWLAVKRTTTFGSFAMAVAESSPSRPVTDPDWIRTSPHEAPPTTGILGLYNTGDRRMFYWPCPHCDEYFVGNFAHLKWDKKAPSIMEQAESVRLECPCCAEMIEWSERYEMLQWGRWLADGQSIDKHGRVSGRGEHNGIASFWLNGIAASFTTWTKLVATYLTAMGEYRRNGSERSLQKFYNTDLGEPYYPVDTIAERTAESLKARAEPFPVGIVPPGVRFLAATVDVQANRFEVQVHGILPGEKFDTVVIDRFPIIKSERMVVIDGEEELAWVKPSSYLEDWDLLKTRVIDKTYELGDGSRRRMSVRIVGCDSGGKAGVTAMAYNYWRKLRAQGLHSRFCLIKGVSTPSAPRVRLDFPDSNRKDRNAGGRGEVPVLFLNPNLIKDDLNGRLDALESGTGMVRFSDQMSAEWFKELCAEKKDQGVWKNPNRLRNESWDLLYYLIGMMISPYVRIEKINWSEPPAWADIWDRNTSVSRPDDDRGVIQEEKAEKFDFSKLGAELA